MSTLIKPAVLVITAAAIGLAVAGGSDLSGFGRVRNAEPAMKRVVQSDIAQQLASLRDAMRIRPDQEHAWSRFVGAIMELDRVTRAFEAKAGSESEAEERARHALLFGIAISEIEGPLSPDQFATLRSRATALGSAFVCSGVRSGAS